MKANNSIITQKKKPSFSMVINSQSMQSMIAKTINEPRRAASFAATLISVVSASRQLSECKPESIISAALRGEGMNLSLALGQFSIVPYGDTANFQISYKGLCQLATRSGQYADFGAFDVREGEYKGKHPRTRQPVIEWLEDDERENLPLSGFYAFYELQNGFFRSIYWTHEKILNHADRYSQAFHKDIYDKMLNGELPPAEVAKYRKGTPWYDDPLSEAHMTMCRKTMLLRLLGDGTAPLSTEMQSALTLERESEKSSVIFPDDPAVVAANSRQQTVQEDDVIDIEASEEPVAEEVQTEPKPVTNSVPKPEPKQEAPKRQVRQQKSPVSDKTAQGQADVPKRREKPSQVTDEPQEGNLPLEEFMNPPTDLSGLPFADV